MIDRIAIVGSGFSGTLQALNLLRHGSRRVVLIERAAEPGRGIAYGAAHPCHLLNVRASNMSAFPDEPEHFVRWLEGRGQSDVAASFAPRLTYGEYLRDMLADARNACPDRLEILRGDVVDLTEDRDVELHLADGGRVRVDAAVLAVGNLPPHEPPGLDRTALPDERYQSDPWSPDPLEGLRDDDTVLLLGSGLTMVDVALALDARGFAGRIVALSRRGLLPRSHEAAQPSWQRLAERPRCRASHLVRHVRDRAREVGWREAVDELRPFTQAMWASAGRAERARFLRHLRPWWDVHRHRLAPSVAGCLAAMVAEGRLTVLAGTTLAFTEGGGSVQVAWRPRGADRTDHMFVRRIVNCTGPLGDLSRTREPLLRALMARRAIRSDAARIGIDVDRKSAVIGPDGRPNPRLFAIGPITRGAFWEIVAVPDIRAQTWTLASHLSEAMLDRSLPAGDQWGGKASADAAPS